MLQFNKEQRRILIFSLIAGVIYLGLLIVLNRVSPQLTNAFSFKYVLRILIAGLLIYGVEFFATKDWKGLLVVLLPAVVYGTIISFAFTGQTQTVYLIKTYFHMGVVYLILRNYYVKKHNSILVLFIGAFFITVLSGSLWQIFFRLTLDTVTYKGINSYPVYVLLSPITVNLLIILFDKLSPKENKSGDLFDLDKSIDGKHYLSNVKSLSLLSALVLIIFILQFYAFGSGRIRAFESLRFQSLIIVFLYLQAMIFIQSHKRIMYTRLPETYLYRFVIPFRNIFAAIKLSKAENDQKKVMDQYHEQRLDFCRNCNHRKTDLYKGMICGLTDEKADFVNICSDFDLRDTIKSATQKPFPSRMVRGLIFFLFIAGIGSALSFIYSLESMRNIETIIFPAAVMITIWLLIYFIYRQRLWALLAYPALIMLLSTINAAQVREIDLDIFWARLVPMIPIVALIWGAMPAWKYIANGKFDQNVLLDGIGEVPQLETSSEVNSQ